ncbi:L,D-transpeptidase-like protein [Palleronia aestuarii]|uniref:L,D-transpeptidase-like protein n=1 Tax=Palleronia aestuarii TaxID=568105 RepID=A0A2W7NJD9_9RHOB|nr:L,D-transpeptidase [Palleronia aestuarii]PZX11412.1 L,D-transpeptidase-like protein [Palleronia aestuarii]
MLTRRHFVASGLALGLAPTSVFGHAGLPHTSRRTMAARDVEVRADIEPDTIHIFPDYFALYHVRAPGFAREYHIAVGAAGRNMTGDTVIRRKEEWPSWTPTANMIRREPETYAQYREGLPGGPMNPLGARALYLYQGSRDTLYRIHGTPQPWTIGTAVSSGCIRLTNSDVMELYPNVALGTPVTTYYN